MLAQMSGQGRFAIGAIAGASVVALVCIGFTGGLAPRGGQPSAVPGNVPVVMTADPGSTTTTDIAYPVPVTTVTTTVASTVTTTTAKSSAPSGAAPPVTTIQTVVTTSAAPPTHPKQPTTTVAPPTTTSCRLILC